MNTPNEPTIHKPTSPASWKTITEIANASADGAYIYRGESKPHDEVSSNLLPRIRR